MNVTLITTVHHCPLCDELRSGVERLARERAITIEEVTWTSDAGRRLIGRDGAAFAPALCVDGVFRGYGRFTERRLREILALVAVQAADPEVDAEIAEDDRRESDHGDPTAPQPPPLTP